MKNEKWKKNRVFVIYLNKNNQLTHKLALVIIRCFSLLFNIQRMHSFTNLSHGLLLCISVNKLLPYHWIKPSQAVAYQNGLRDRRNRIHQPYIFRQTMNLEITNSYRAMRIKSCQVTLYHNSIARHYRRRLLATFKILF